MSSTSVGCGVQRAIFYPKIACNLAFQYIVVVWKHGKEAKAFLLIPFMHKTKRSHYRVSKINILGHPVLCTQLFNLQRHQNYHFEKTKTKKIDNFSTTYVKHPRCDTISNKNGLIFVNHLKMTSYFKNPVLNCTLQKLTKDESFSLTM